MKLFSFLLGAMVAGQMAVAGDFGTSAAVGGLSEGESVVNMSSVEKVVTLVHSYSDANDSLLRMSFTVVDNGGSTDVSPKARLFLTSFNETEMMGAHSVHFIEHINSLESAKRIDAGVYEAIVSFYDYEQVCASSYEARMKITVDARQLSMDVRNFKGVGEFENGNITTPVKVTKTCL